jgi:hypothetical protein
MILALVGVAVLAAPVGASAAPGCAANGAQVVARSGTALLLTSDAGPDDGQYGPGTRVSTCRRGHPRVTLLSTQTGTSLVVAHPAFTSGYVAFAWNSSSVVCSKYLGDDPQCRSAGVASYNRRTGRRRASGSGPADALVVTPAGWLAWLSPADATGARTLQAVDSAGARVLATGAIDPASLRADGATISWTAAGAPAAVALN